MKCNAARPPCGAGPGTALSAALTKSIPKANAFLVLDKTGTVTITEDKGNFFK